MLLPGYSTVRDPAGLSSTSSLLVKQLFSSVNDITSSLLGDKIVRYVGRAGGENENAKWP